MESNIKKRVDTVLKSGMMNEVMTTTPKQTGFCLNGIRKIRDDAGDYIVLSDYGQEGICVSHQCESVLEAIQHLALNDIGNPQSIVKLVRLKATEL